ncbi:tryptophan 2,3-dioxygenase [Actinomadura citrea]|uniref:tryptophan 2,3-dioxygenase n=1 Tax=Actinomadura citrea TaxID=46158 RepID=UPI003CE55B23
MNTDLEPSICPVTEQERVDRAAAGGGEPTLAFTGRVPYDAYIHAGTLHTLQQTLSDDPGEMSFLVISQVMELYFGLLRHELREGQRLIREDDVWGALPPLRRASLHLEGLNAGWHGLRWMTPTDFNRFRDKLGEGSGFQSAMYRHLEFLLGLRTASLVRPFRRQPDVHAELTEALRAPSLWDDTVALLARKGHDIPADLLGRDHSQEHQPHPAVEGAWVEVYTDTGPDNHLRMLGEALTDVAERFGDWRYQHLVSVRRAMGAKAGSGGSNGIQWLQRSMAREVFPELWSARTYM